VPAGTFETIRLRTTERGAAGNTYHGVTDTWIDVATNAPVRRAYTHLGGTMPRGVLDWQAVSVVRT
jgi:hypothetical protein